MLYGCETWTLTLREKSMLNLFENRVLRRIFELKRDESGQWKRLHYEEPHSVYRLSNINAIKSKILKWAQHVPGIEEGAGILHILTGLTTEK